MCPEGASFIVTYAASHAAIRAERNVKALGLRVELIPVPREISSACGFCLLVSGAGGVAGPDPGAGRDAGIGAKAIAGVRTFREVLESATELTRESLWLVIETKGPGLRRKEKRYERIS